MDGDRAFSSGDQPISVVRGLGSGSLQARPFAHLWSASCLAPAHHEALVATLPPVGSLLTDTHLSLNAGIRLPSSRVLETRLLSDEWRRFVEHHTSLAFWRRLAQVFGAEIRFLYPDLERELDRPMEDWRVVRRSDETGAEITLECEIVVTPSVTECPSPPEAPQTTSTTRLWTGLLSLCADNDEGAANFSGEPEAVPRDALCRLPFPQTANTFVGFVESPNAERRIVAPKCGRRSRRFVEFSVQVNHPVIGLISRGAAEHEWFRFFRRQGYR